MHIKLFETFGPFPTKRIPADSVLHSLVMIASVVSRQDVRIFCSLVNTANIVNGQDVYIVYWILL